MGAQTIGVYNVLLTKIPIIRLDDSAESLQEDISFERLQGKIGKTLRVLVDETIRGGAIGRSSADAPEIDGLVYVKKPKGMRRKLLPGEFIHVRIGESDDLWGQFVPEESKK